VVHVSDHRRCVKVVAAHEGGRHVGEAALDEREHVVSGAVRQVPFGDHEIELHLFEEADRLGNIGCDDGERVEVAPGERRALVRRLGSPRRRGCKGGLARSTFFRPGW
jgi:hypothetical protein